MKISTLLLRRTALAVLLVFSLGAIISCAPAEEAEVDEATQQMLDYYDKENVQNFHREMQTSLNDVVEALDNDDEKVLAKSLSSLDDLCDEFIEVTDVPESLKPYHDKMIGAARSIKAFSKGIAGDDYISAAKELEDAQDLLNEAQKLLPETSGAAG